MEFQLERVSQLCGWESYGKLVVTCGFFGSANPSAVERAVQTAEAFCDACGVPADDLCSALCTVIDRTGRRVAFGTYLVAIGDAVQKMKPAPDPTPEPPKQPRRDPVAPVQQAAEDQPSMFVHMELSFGDVSDITQMVCTDMVKALPRGSIMYTKRSQFDNGRYAAVLEVVNNEPKPVVEVYVLRRNSNGDYSEFACAFEPQSALLKTYEATIDARKLTIVTN